MSDVFSCWTSDKRLELTMASNIGLVLSWVTELDAFLIIDNIRMNNFGKLI